MAYYVVLVRGESLVRAEPIAVSDDEDLVGFVMGALAWEKRLRDSQKDKVAPPSSEPAPTGAQP